MNRSALSVCTLAAIAMAGCTTYYDPPPATPVTTTSGAPVQSAASVSAAPANSFRPGTGIVESISLVNPPASASAGATQAASGAYRVTMRMNDGSTQTLTVDTRAVLVGDRLQITPEGRLIRF
jgi:hypothetical protein